MLVLVVDGERDLQDRLAFVVDEDAEPADVLPVLARLLITLTERRNRRDDRNRPITADD